MLKRYVLPLLSAVVMLLGLCNNGLAATGVEIPGELEVGGLKFPDGTSQNSASSVTRIWSGVADLLSPGQGGTAPYYYLVSRVSTGNCIIYFNYNVSVCVVSSRSADARCHVAGQPYSNANAVQCRMHSDNSLVDTQFSFICLGQ